MDRRQRDGYRGRGQRGRVPREPEELAAEDRPERSAEVSEFFGVRGEPQGPGSGDPFQQREHRPAQRPVVVARRIGRREQHEGGPTGRNFVHR